MKDTEDCSSL